MTKTPHVPPENLSPKGKGDTKNIKDDDKSARVQNIDEQGDRANIRQNSTNQGYNNGR